MEAVVTAVRRWLEEAVIDLELCPFAGTVHERGAIRFAVSDAVDAQGAVHDALAEAILLVETPESEVATTLVLVPRALADFETFLDAAATLVSALDEAGAGGVLQVPTFHPDYRFEGEDEGALGSFTNRAPCPIFHLLREDHVSEAIANHPDPEGIPARNVERLEALGADQIARMWERFGV